MSSSSLRPDASQAGFTLLEVLISMAVMVFLAFGIFQATTETYRLRDILSAEGDFYNTIRLAMDVVQRDVSLIYSPIIMMPDKNPNGTAVPNPQSNTDSGAVPMDQDMQDILSSDLGQTTRFWGPALDKTGIRSGHFIGKATEMSFVGASNIRIYRDAPESEFVQVAYTLEADKVPVDPQSRDQISTSVLVKSVSSDAFDDDQRRTSQFAHRYPLLRGIASLQFQYCYMDRDAEKCSSAWDSESADLKNRYPDKIKVAMTVKGRLHLSFDGIYVFRPEIPLRGLNPSS